MPAFLKTLMICLALFAIGSAQLLGVQAGYLCGCTGERSVKTSCEVAQCHKGKDHPSAKNTIGQPSSPVELLSVSGEIPNHGHKHSELRQSLPLTGLPAPVTVPSVLFFDLPPSFQVLEISREAPSSLLLPDVATMSEDRCPTASLVVARTVVMLV